MIKRIIGLVLAIVALAVIVMAVVRHGSYTSMVELPWFNAPAKTAEPPVAESPAMAVPDSLQGSEQNVLQ